MSCMRTIKEKTSTTLGNAGVFTSQAIKTEMYNQIRGVVSTDQGGTLDFEESSDGTTWIKTDTKTITGGTPLGFIFTCHAYFSRVKLTNGATPQTSLDLQIYADPFQ